MDYGALHLAGKHSAIPNVIGFFLQMGPWQLVIYISIFSVIAYVIKKRREEKK